MCSRRAAGALFVLMLGCGRAPPPYEALPLRDSLLASPSVVAELSPEAKLQLRRRFEQAIVNSPNDPVVVGNPERATASDDPGPLLATYDRQLREQGSDVVPLLLFRTDGSASWIQAQRQLAEVVLPTLENSENDNTANLEQLALSGEAGRYLGALMSGATHLRRSVGWPVAALASGNTVYVNAAWLVIMAENEPANIPATATLATATLATVPNLALQKSRPALALREVVPPALFPPIPRAIPTYASTADCISDQESRCATCLSNPAQCAPAPVLSDFATTTAECTWLQADTSGVDGGLLCLSLELQRKDINSCLALNDGGCLPSGPAQIETIAYLKNFDNGHLCSQTLSDCLADPSFQYKISCNAYCNETCAQSCGSCGTTDNCNGNNGCGSSNSSNSNNKCSAVNDHAFLINGLMAFWIGLPLLYLWQRARGSKLRPRR